MSLSKLCFALSCLFQYNLPFKSFQAEARHAQSTHDSNREKPINSGPLVDALVILFVDIFSLPILTHSLTSFDFSRRLAASRSYHT